MPVHAAEHRNFQLYSRINNCMHDNTSSQNYTFAGVKSINDVILFRHHSHRFDFLD